jgi:hypothetical protein
MQANNTHPCLHKFQVKNEMLQEVIIMTFKGIHLIGWSEHYFNTRLLLLYPQQKLSNKTFNKIMEFLLQNKIIFVKAQKDIASDKLISTEAVRSSK